MANRSLSLFVLLALTLAAEAQQPYPAATLATQKERDMDRRLILETELSDEFKALEKAIAALDTHQTDDTRDAVHRHKENINALKRELDRGASVDRSPTQQRVVIKAIRPTTGPITSAATQFWDPYTRLPDSSDSSTSPRRESHE